MQVTAEDIQVISRLVNDLCGIVLDETKGYLIQARLAGLVTASGCKSYTELYQKARHGTDKALQTRIIDAITTNETLFFRDGSPFEVLQYRILPELIDARMRSNLPKRIRIWSAACSTGQEPYSIAMTLRELLPDFARWDCQILATDISDAVIKQASAGTYGPLEIQRGMKQAMLSKYFVQSAQGWKIKDELRAMITFRRLNLLQPFDGLGPFDVIFCRNVAIYFSAQDRRSLFLRLAKELTSQGYLLVGAAESLSDLGPAFAPQHHCRTIYYQPNRLTAAVA